MLHAQVKPPAYVVAEIAVRDQEGYEKNFLEPTRKEISDHGGKYLAGGYNKTLSLTRYRAAQPRCHTSVPEHGRGQGVARTRQHDW